MGYVAMSRGRLGNHLYAVGERRMEIEPTHAPTVEEAADDLLVAALRTSRAQIMASERAPVVNPLAAVSDAELGRETGSWCRSRGPSRLMSRGRSKDAKRRSLSIGPRSTVSSSSARQH